ncbi:MAG: SocA family protein [Planctomycetes bacterium]|nr:SocA family protein [Planctomycetota bacterium]
MSFRLDKQKAVQAAAVLLKCAPNWQMSRLRLLKLMYLADRASLSDKGRPITGDQIVAMDHGPVLSGVYDFIKNTHADPEPWPSHIQSQHHDVLLMSDPGVGDLSRYEVGKLQELWGEYEDISDWRLVEDVVDKLPEYLEYKPAPRSRRPIPFRAILTAVGRANDVDRILQEAAEERMLDRLWARATQTA